MSKTKKSAVKNKPKIATTRSGMKENKLYGLSHQDLLDRVERLEKSLAATTSAVDIGRAVGSLQPVEGTLGQILGPYDGMFTGEILRLKESGIISLPEAREKLGLTAEYSSIRTYRGHTIIARIVFETEHGYLKNTLREAESAIDHELDNDTKQETPHEAAE